MAACELADLAATNPRLEPSTPMAPTKRRGHLPPHALKAGAHLEFAVPEHPPLPYVSCAGLEVQRPGDTAAGETPVEQSAAVLRAIR